VTPLSWASLAVAAVAAGVDWWVVWTATAQARTVERLAKPLALAGLLGVALATPASVPGVEPWLAVGLAASVAGDILLLSPARLVPGLIAFLLGHLAYIVALLHLSGSQVGLLVGVAIAAAVTATVGRSLVRAAAGRGMGVPVGAYLLVISVMAIMATRTGSPAAVLGGWLFVASDSLLGWREFAAPAPTDGGAHSRLQLGVMTTYHAAQALLVLALLTGA
jgi:uncharacterized membrane protein YhhN